MSGAREAWYRVPIVWLGIAILAVAIAGSAVMIVLALRHPDPPIQLDREPLIRVPESRDRGS